MQFMKKTTLNLMMFLGITLVIGLSSAFAQHGYRVTKRISFKSGQVATTVKGTIPNILEGHEYIFRARQGQTLLINLTSVKKDIGFFILTPDGEMLEGQTGLRKWTGELSETGEYRLIINTRSKGVAAYSFKIQMATDI
jgi:hypothetical protein